MSELSKKGIRGLGAICLCLVMLLSLGVTGFAVTLDLSGSGTLTVQPKYGNRDVAGGRFEIYLVANAEPVNDHLSFALTEEFEETELDLDSINTTSEASSAIEALMNLIDDDDLVPYTTVSGGATATLPLGMYLIVQISAPGYYTRSVPFLAATPSVNSDGTGWVYSATVNPKMGYDEPYVPDSPTPAPNPTSIPIPSYPVTNTIADYNTPLDGPGGTTTILDDAIPLAAPQTGMLNWPVPVLSSLGVIFIALGLVMGRKKKYE